MKAQANSNLLADLPASQAIVRLALPATVALLAKAVYNIVDTAYIGMLGSDLALTAVGGNAAAAADHGVIRKYLCGRCWGIGRPSIGCR